MARALFRVASDPPPSEPDPGDPICHHPRLLRGRCGLRKTWVVEPCYRDGCPGFWAWRCPAGRHRDIDDTLELAAHGLSHDTRAQEIAVEGLHHCPGCGARDWEAGGYWATTDLQTLRFRCRSCQAVIPVHEFVLYSLTGAYREFEAARPRRDEPSRPCSCGRSKMHPDTDWIGPECRCCGAVIYYDVANWARPLCRVCQAPPSQAPPAAPGTAAWAW